MTFSGLFPFVLLALGTLAPWAVEGAENALKAGDCPPREPANCFKYDKPECNNDWQCPEKKRCCPDYCGIRCLDPVNILNSAEEKPGKCPVFDTQCLMLNPPNRCETDSQCVGELKCCKGTCGKACIFPVKGKEGLGQADLLPSSSLSQPSGVPGI
ncbi:PREDICTED: LOW QUALITY PROTEIN: antileukoproteinase [Lipotes vexillifer]|uniref:LOW QUALITY PROTEIN: antileukoproteinase n=1 Tax=Lipotes vexillifer TaxID=118797 RepID=A0A340XXB1_LIPVE|nr:PREDICTED: LOW QUALITY PROTEIN: antileukoproteinase [Lipotes vexillifer]